MFFIYISTSRNRADRNGWALRSGIFSLRRTSQQASAARQIEGHIAQLLHTANGATFAPLLWITDGPASRSATYYLEKRSCRCASL